MLDKIDLVELNLLRSDVKYAREYLEDEGIDLKKESELASKHLKKIRFMASAIIKKECDESLLEVAYSRLKAAFIENVGGTTQTLISMLRSKNPAIQYRNLEDWKDDEIKDVLRDLDLVELLEELDKDST